MAFNHNPEVIRAIAIDGSLQLLRGLQRDQKRDGI